MSSLFTYLQKSLKEHVGQTINNFQRRLNSA